MKKAGLLFILLLTSMILAACGSHTFTIDDELEIEIEGLEGEGIAYYSIDEERIYRQLVTQLKIKNTEKNKEKIKRIREVVESLSVTMSPDAALSNGDKIKLTLSYDESNKAKIKFKLKETTYEVSGLEDYQTLNEDNVFDGVHITYDDISPSLILGIKNNDLDLQDFVSYSLPHKKYRVGEEFEVTATVYEDPNPYGFKTDKTSFTKTFTVPRQKKQYITSWDELNDDAKMSVLQIAIGYREQYVDRFLNSSHSLYNRKNRVGSTSDLVDIKPTVYSDMYFLLRKPDAENHSVYSKETMMNAAFIVFAHPLTLGAGPYIDEQFADKELPYHTVIGVRNIMIDEEGELMVDKLNPALQFSFELDLDYIDEEIKRVNTSTFEITKVDWTPQQ